MNGTSSNASTTPLPRAPDPLPVAFADTPAQRWLWAITRRDGDPAQIEAGHRRMIEAWTHRLAELQPGLQVQVVGVDDARADQAWSNGANQLGIGLVLVARIDAACLKLASLLTLAYQYQSMGLGPTLPLPLLVPAQRFPGEALGLSPERLTPRAIDPAGELRPLIDNLLGATASMRQGRKLSIADLRAAGARIPKPLRFGTSSVDGPALLGANPGGPPGEPQPHLAALYAQVLSDAIGFVLAHEAAHLRHGDAAPAADSAEVRRREVAADAGAIDTLTGIAGCNLRSVALLFACVAETEDPLPDAWMSHPFATDRLALLAAALPPEAGVGARADLDVALQLVRKPLQLWGEACDSERSQAWYAADLEHRAIVELRATAPDGQPLRSCDVEARWCLYDRTNPDREWRSGSVRLRPAQNWSFEIALPPSLWLDHPDAGLRLDGLELAAAGSWCQEGCAHQYRSDQGLTDDQAVAAALALPPARIDLLAMACARALDNEPPELTERLVPLWIAARAAAGGERRPTLLRWLARRWAGTGQTVQARALLEQAVAEEPYLPEGLRGQLGALLWAEVEPRLPDTGSVAGSSPPAAAADGSAPGPADVLADADRDLLDRSRDLLLREQVLFAPEDGTIPGAPPIADVLKAAHWTPLGRAFLDGMQARRHGDAVAASEPQHAAAWYGHAAQELAEILQQRKLALPYHWQISGEHLLACAAKGGVPPEAVLQIFDHVLYLDPSFLPASTEAAKMAMEAGQLPLTQRYLDAADRLFPAHRFIEYVRQECRRRRAVEQDRLVETYSAAYAAGQWDEARAQATTLDALNPASGMGAYALGMLERRVGQYPEACTQLQRAVEQGDALFEWSRAWAEAQASGGDPLAAWETLTIAIGGAAHAPSTEATAQGQSAYLGYGNQQGVLAALARRNQLAVQLGLPRSAAGPAAAEPATAPAPAGDDTSTLHWPPSFEIEIDVRVSGGAAGAGTAP